MFGQYLFSQSCEEIASTKEIQYEVQFSRSLKSVVQFDDKRVPNIDQDVPLHFRPVSVSHLQRGLLQDLHGVQGAGVRPHDFPDQEHLPEGPLAQNFEQLKLRGIGLLVPFTYYLNK